MKRIFVPVLILLTLTACGKLSEEDLMGGEWFGTAGYENGEVGGEPFCPPMQEGIVFIDEEHAVVEYMDREYLYSVYDEDDGFYLILNEIEPETMFIGATFHGKMLSDNEMVWQGEVPSPYNCYMERQKKGITDKS